MSNFAKDIAEAVEGERIEGVVIGRYGWGVDEDREVEEVRNKLIDWKRAEPLLDYDYDTGYGMPSCHSVYVWTPTRVLFVSQYDGATAIDDVPRNPIDCDPTMPGG